MASLWGVLTRLKECEAVEDPVKLAKLYDGQSQPGFTEDRVREIRETRVGEGMDFGISARYIQDSLSACLSDNHTYINPFMLVNELERRLKLSAVFSADKDLLKHYLDCIDAVKKELDEILKNEVKNALISDEKAVIRLCTNYIDNLMADLEGSKVINEFTGREEEPNEALMRSIEEKIRVPDTGSRDFRMMIQGYIGRCHHEGKEFNWKSNADLRKALEAKLFEDTKDHIKLSALNVKGASTVDPDLQEKIDVIKKRMVEKFGYIEESATDVLNYVGSIFARGGLAKEEDE
jgi:serine protein kinase